MFQLIGSRQCCIPPPQKKMLVLVKRHKLTAKEDDTMIITCCSAISKVKVHYSGELLRHFCNHVQSEQNANMCENQPTRER